MIRKTKPSDYKQIESLMKSVEGFWDEGWRDNAIELGVGSSENLSFVDISENKIVGFICAHDCGFRAYLSELIVDPAKQGQGIAKKLLEKVENELRKRKCKVLIADVWKDSVSFYEKQGWEKPGVILLRKKTKK